jgi:hypothetical protein
MIRQASCSVATLTGSRNALSNRELIKRCRSDIDFERLTKG